jgi:hypothetical protein
MEAKELGILKDRFNGFEYPVNEEIWKRIEARPAKPKKSSWKYLAIAASFGMVMLIGYSLNQKITRGLNIFSNPTSMQDQGIKDYDPPVQKSVPIEVAKKFTPANSNHAGSHSIPGKKANSFYEAPESQLPPTIAELSPNNPSSKVSHPYASEYQGNDLIGKEENTLINPVQQMDISRGASVKIQLVFSDYGDVAQDIKKPKINFAKLKRKFKKEINLKRMKDKAKSIFVLGKRTKKTAGDTDSTDKEVKLN